MKKNKITDFFLIFILSLFSIESMAQQKEIDSLLTILKNAKEDTNKVKLLNQISWESTNISNYDSALNYVKQAIVLAKKLNYKKGIANAYNQFGNIYSEQGNFAEALKNHFASLKIKKELGSKIGMAGSYSNIGLVYNYQGNYVEALKNFFIALKLNEETGNKKWITVNYNNIGNIYADQKEYTKALKYYFASLKIEEELGNKDGMANSFINIGLAYHDQGNDEDALKNYNKALEIYEELERKSGIAMVYTNLAGISYSRGNYEAALEKYFASLKIQEDIGDKDRMALSYSNIGIVEYQLKNYNDSRTYLKKGLQLSKEIGSKTRIRHSFKGLSQLDSATGNWRGAYENHKMYILYRDSLFNEENTKKTIQSQMNYEFDKKEQAIKLQQEKKDAIAKQEIQKQKVVRNSFMGGFALVLLLAGVATRGYKQKQKANQQLEEKNHTIEKQKEIVEEKQKEIVDSINYARRIQYTLLADEALLKSNLHEHFILFKPKDIVSGDFYWGTKKENRFYLAVCDSTGHGVPGAFMSVLNSSFLNEAINEKNIIAPHLILNYVRERLINSVSADGGQDGMDCTLICIENNMDTITYASANNKPIHISNGELVELQANKMPVGKGEIKDSFTSYQVDLRKGDIIYLFTDGFADQFGGASGAKKLTKKKFKELLLSIKDNSMQEQGIALDTFITDYRKDIEQIDDILVMGIKV
jgi:serine phosphatase RsbU (regulator of sigma subunit)/Tfp pilus assembly protein PilF